MGRAAVPAVLVGILVAIAPALGAAPVSRTTNVSPAASGEALVEITRIIEAMPSSSAVRAVRLAREAKSASLPAPKFHAVESGDTLWSIARSYGLTVEHLAAVNGMSLEAILPLGAKLVVPSDGRLPQAASAGRTGAQASSVRSSAVVHVVRSGETLWDISLRYGVKLEDVMARNELGHSDWIKPGQRILVSGAPLPRHRQIAAQSRSRTGPVMADASLLRSGGAFIWPARGTLTSRFGWRYRRHHEGIDLAAPRGTPIYAARDGVVEFSGWRGGYGRAVFVNHGGGIVTVYGHASKLLVDAGQRVKKGQLIAKVGCTGVCTGSHLHFEVRVGGRATNPLPYLR